MESNLNENVKSRSALDESAQPLDQTELTR